MVTVSSNVDQLGESEITITTPAHSEGDLLLFFAYHGSKENFTSWSSEPSGFTFLSPFEADGGITDPIGFVWWKIATASEPADYTLILDGFMDISGACVCVQANNYEVSTNANYFSVVQNGGTNSITPGSVTVKNNYVVIVTGICDNGFGATGPSGYTEIDQWEVGGWVHYPWIGYKIISTDGIESPSSLTFLSGEDNDDFKVSLTLVAKIVSVNIGDDFFWMF